MFVRNPQKEQPGPPQDAELSRAPPGDVVLPWLSVTVTVGSEPVELAGGHSVTGWSMPSSESPGPRPGSQNEAIPNGDF